ncbi:MAG: PriCT-2 domain-containing protein [Rikenellaceae bacterium]|nr:PriCT-2 domain-containing protein [Rikenellaceae bacterium]MCL2692067.1 PriCT-2 domain-containing protein [Rikenellaceae bacterium]
MKTTLNVDVSFYGTLTTKNPVIRDLFDLLTGKHFAESIAAVREEPDPKKQNAFKKALPMFTPSGVFSSANDKSLSKHSGLICIDIDKKDNPDVENFDAMKELISQVPYVAYCGLSARGEGYFCIIPIKFTEKHKQHFNSLLMDFARCGITIDKGCGNVGRKRFVSDDQEYYHNSNAEVYDRYVSDARPATRSQAPLLSFKDKDTHVTPVMVDELIAIIEEKGIDITKDYDDWFAIGCALANYFGDDGRERFHTVSQFYPGYSPNLTDKKFDDALKKRYNHNIATFLHHAKRCGVTAIADFRDIPDDLI